MVMKTGNHIFSLTRRRFLGLLGTLGTVLSWPVRGSREARLSRHEASFYRKGNRDDARTWHP
jgi:hypothetical protein